MLPNAFIDHPGQPDGEELAAALGPAAQALWTRLVAALAEDGAGAAEWHSYSRKAGWALRLKRGERNIVYLSPARGAFMASFALGDKAMQAARKSKLPAPAVKILDEARRYAEGTAVRVEVRTDKDVATVRKIAAAKLAN